MKKPGLRDLLLGKQFFALIFVLVLLHIAILGMLKYEYGHRTKTENFIPLLVTTAQKLPPSELSTWLKLVMGRGIVIHGHVVIMTIDNTPQYSTHLSINANIDVIQTTLLTMKQPGASIKLNDHQWLNYHKTYSYTYYERLAIVLLIETLVIGAILFYLLIILRFTKSLKDFKQSADRLGIDVNAAPIEGVYGPKLIQETAEAINKMQARIQELIQARTRMLAAIAHDLRTPLTRIKLRAQFIDDPQIDKIIHDVDEMESMISGILSFARNDMSKEKKIYFDLNALINSICDEYADTSRPVYLDSPPRRVVFFGRPLAIKRLITNLIENALKYAGEAWVILSIENSHINILIEDKGPGIPEHELGKVFEAFYRSEHSRHDSSTGTGLGLTIAYETVHAHNGEISLHNRPEGGLQVRISFPNSQMNLASTQ